MNPNFEQKKENWKKIVKHYSTPDEGKSWFQVANTLIPYFVLWFLSYQSLKIHFALSLFFSVLLAGFMVRTFIIMHDCGHGSFFKSSKKRTIVGYITGFLTWTPYWQWTNDHAIHHQTSGNLDKRGHGDVWTATVNEYKEMSFWGKIGYRLYRFPPVTFLLGPIFVFQWNFRFFKKHDGPKEKQSVIICNIFLVLMLATAHFTIGLKDFFIVHGIATLIAQIAGTWLFYVQHQYEGVYWRRNESWDYFDSAMEGSSYFKLPAPLQWISGNIGFHHLHHLSHKIPNYKLQKAMEENEIFKNPYTITMGSSLKSAFMHIYDEEHGDLISFGEYSRRYSRGARSIAYLKELESRAKKSVMIQSAS